MSRAPLDASTHGAAVFLLAVGVFTGALGAGILGAEVTGSVLDAMLLRASFGSLLGSIALGAVGSAIELWSGPPSAPAAALDRCLICGARRAGERCAVCATPAAEVPIHAQREGWVGPLIGGALLGALLPLGLWLLLAPYSDGERRVWVLVAFAALGLPLCAGGVVALIGTVHTLRQRGVRDVALTFSSRDTEGRGLARGPRLVWLAGRGEVSRPLATAPATSSEPSATIARIATLVAAGVVTIEVETVYEWRLDRETLTRTTARTRTRAAPAARPGPPDTLHAAVAAFVAGWIDDEPSVNELYGRFDADVNGAQAAAHADALARAGVTAAPALVDAVRASLSTG